MDVWDTVAPLLGCTTTAQTLPEFLKYRPTGGGVPSYFGNRPIFKDWPLSTVLKGAGIGVFRGSFNLSRVLRGAGVSIFDPVGPGAARDNSLRQRQRIDAVDDTRASARAVFATNEVVKIAKQIEPGLHLIPVCEVRPIPLMNVAGGKFTFDVAPPYPFEDSGSGRQLRVAAGAVGALRMRFEILG